MNTNQGPSKNGVPLNFDILATRWVDCEVWMGTNQFIEFKINGMSLLGTLSLSANSLTTLPIDVGDGVNSPFKQLLPDTDLIPYSKRVVIYFDTEDSEFQIGGGVSVEVVFADQYIIWHEFHSHPKYEPDEFLVVREVGPYYFEYQQYIEHLTNVFEKS